MKKWQTITAISILCIFILIGGGVIFNNYENTRIALVDIEYSRNGLKNYQNEVKEMSEMQAKRFKLDTVTVINTIYFTSKWAKDLSADLKSNPAEAQTRVQIYALATEISAYAKKLGIKNDYRENSNKSQFVNFVKLMLDIREDYPEDFEAVIDTLIKMHKGDKNINVIFYLELYRENASLIKSHPAEFIELISQVIKATKTNDDARQAISRLSDLVYTTNNIKKGCNNAYDNCYEPSYKPYIPNPVNKAYFTSSNKDYLNEEYIVYTPQIEANKPYFVLNTSQNAKRNYRNIKPSEVTLAVILDLNNINITEFLEEDDVDKMVILWNLSAKANAELSR